MLGYIIQVPINWGQSNINLSGFLWLGALSSQAEGGFLMLEYQKSSAAFSLTAQLRMRVKFPTTITAARSCVRKSLHPRLKLRLPHLPKHKCLQICSPLHALI